MPTTVTLAQLTTRVRTAVRQPNASGFISDSEIETLIYEGAYELYDLLIKAHGADYYSYFWSFNTTSGIREYNLPSDFYRLVSIAGTDTAGTVGAEITDPVTVPSGAVWGEIPRFNAPDFAFHESYQASSPIELRYALTGTAYYGLGGHRDQIRFFPVPIAMWCVQIVYIPTLQVASGEEVVFNGINGWESYIVAHAAATIAAMQEDDPGFWMAKKAEIKDRISTLAADRDQAQPEQVGDRWGDRDDALYRRRFLLWR